MVHRASHCSGFSYWGAQARGHGGSVVGAHAPSCPSGIRDLLGPGIEPVFLALAGGFLTIGPPGESSAFYFVITY